MIEFILEYLFSSAQQANAAGLMAGEFVLALGLGLWGYKLYSSVEKPTGDWDETLKILSILMMAFGAVDALITFFRLI